MKALSIVRNLAALSLAIFGIESAIGYAHAFGMSAANRAVAPFFQLAIWGGLTWMVWARPRTWGLGVGIFVFVVILFQSSLFHFAMADPLFREQGYNWETFLAFRELPLFLAGVFGISLRFIHPAPGTPPTLAPQPQNITRNQASLRP